MRFCSFSICFSFWSFCLCATELNLQPQFPLTSKGMSTPTSSRATGAWNLERYERDRHQYCHHAFEVLSRPAVRAFLDRSPGVARGLAPPGRPAGSAVCGRGSRLLIRLGALDGSTV